MTPPERAKRAIADSDLEECITAAVQAERNAGDLRLADATAALQAALGELAKVKQERDGLAAAIKEYRRWYDVCGFNLHTDKALRAACDASTGLDSALKSPAESLAAHDRKVAAGVLRSIVGNWWKGDNTRNYLMDIAAEYEAGTREVPGE